MRTLVTGGAGYIGKELVDELLNAGRDVTVLDVLLHGQSVDELTQRGVRFVEGDIRDPDARRAATSSCPCSRTSRPRASCPAASSSSTSSPPT